MDNQLIRVTVDAVVFGYENQQIKVLIIQQKYGPYKDQWALPGGFVKNDEKLITAVERELKEETNVTINYLEQLYTFGDTINRDKRARVISIAYFALTNPKNFKITAKTDAKSVAWIPIEQLPELAFDHQQIIQKAYNRLQNKIEYQPIGFNLLNKEFLFSEIEQLYQTIMGKKIDRRNFRKKILSFGILIPTQKTRKQEAGRPGRLYTFNQKKYKELEANGFNFEIKFA